MHPNPTYLLLVLLLIPSGCKHEQAEPGNWTTCICAYLTDFDDPAKHSLDICLPQGTNAEHEALACAGKLAHGPVENCTCAPPGEICHETRACKSNEYK